MIACGISDIGQIRKENQDYFVNCTFSDQSCLAVVCDGMGGLAGGREASRIAGDAFVASFSAFHSALDRVLTPSDEKLVREALVNAAWDANDAIFQKKKEVPELAQMGTTLVCVYVFGSVCCCLNIGDSRMYWLHEGLCEQVTKDHSLVQYLVDVGQMTSEEAAVSANRNIITKALGISASVEPDVFFFDLVSEEKRQFLLLCSDGFSNCLHPGEIFRYFEDSFDGDFAESDLMRVLEQAVTDVNLKGAPDNVTADVVVFTRETESGVSA
ncbi:MAG: serine/threonine-protein phosphatase [Clostridia bacterium]|nr:serine/threonine-protein phosphatase [Clostridia bacterium]